MGFWGEKDTSISFCEEPYKKSHYIAEYYNSLSGLIYIIVGLTFLKTRVRNMGYTLISLGAGTFFLHSTQKWQGQWLDELSMLLLSFQAITYLRNMLNKKTHHEIFYSMFLIYLFFHKQTFIIMFTGSQLYILQLLKKIRPKDNYKVTSYLLKTSYKYIFLISTAAWLLDQLFCEYVYFLYLHSWWHIGTGVVAFLGLQNLLISE